MQIKKQTDQAIRLLMHLSCTLQPMIGKELAKRIGVSEKYLPFIMQQLRRAGLVLSFSGISGGYVLAKSAKKITLLDVMAATSDEPNISCYDKNEKKGSHIDDSDVLLKSYDIVRDFATQYFGSLTICDLFDPKKIDGIFSEIEQAGSIIEDRTKVNVASAV